MEWKFDFQFFPSNFPILPKENNGILLACHGRTTVEIGFYVTVQP
jgi:hypothetical protein